MVIPITGCLEHLAGKTCLIRGLIVLWLMAELRTALGLNVFCQRSNLLGWAGLVLISHLGRPKGK